MISPMGRKIFFIHPPESLKDSFLEYIFKNEFEIYLLESHEKLPKLLDHFKDAIVFINIDYGLNSTEWTQYIRKLQRKFRRVIIGVFSKSDSSSLNKTYLMNIGIKGGFIEIKQDNWKTIEIINQVLEVNEARGRRKSVRLDFDEKELRRDVSVRVYSHKGYSFSAELLSISSSGLLVSLKSGMISTDDNIEKVILSMDDEEMVIQAYLLKRFENGNMFLSFRDIRQVDKDSVQSYIFNHLQNSFKILLNNL